MASALAGAATISLIVSTLCTLKSNNPVSGSIPTNDKPISLAVSAAILIGDNISTFNIPLGSPNVFIAVCGNNAFVIPAFAFKNVLPAPDNNAVLSTLVATTPSTTSVLMPVIASKPPVIDDVNPDSDEPTVFIIFEPKAAATFDVIISATKPNNEDEPFDIN